MLRAYYELAKPGIVYGNVLTALAALLFGARFDVSVGWLLSLSFGLGLMIGSACVFNNYLDRDMDRAMQRTKGRAFAAGLVPVGAGLSYGAALGCIGFALLYYGAYPLAAYVALAGFLVYVALYTPLKRVSMHATIVGAVSGAVPPVVGYVSATGTLDIIALALFLILALWQMPHFYAISLFRRDDYAAAKVPVISLVRDVSVTIMLLRAYIVLFAIAALMPSVIGATGYSYAVVMAATSGWWLVRAASPATDSVAWGRSVFGTSLIVLLTWCVALPAGVLLP